MWERFSYYGMRSLLVLYMVDHLFLRPDVGQRVLGFDLLKGGLEAVFGPLAGAAPLLADLRALHRARLPDPVLRRDARGQGARPAPRGDPGRPSDGHRPLPHGRRVALLPCAPVPDPRQRRLQAEHLDPGRQPLPAGRPAPRPRLHDLLHGDQPRRVLLAPRLRHARAEARLALRLRRRRRRHGRGPLRLPARAAHPRPRPHHEKGRSPAREAAADTRRAEACLGARAPLRAQHRLLGGLRAAGQHHAALGRPEHELEFPGRGHPLDLVPVVQPAR